ncbi:GNAT family N-acetyltransferase [Bacillus cereus group sp. MYBK71-2]|uniref:GNAT family N-acetyltransferase n=1 Tax=Bacillus cereus group TaxID=86661 RepID=UPI000CD8FD87|nr:MULTISPECIES: GNAT family N-acetyltransferase [Bacillus cereus group]UTG81693.1 GNAT family N-acetyltransferase [Bacillus paranthracis]MCC2338072.1 GNAT family N-acetyltransferase [Bacillus tropicus]MCU5421361.1 GNAT family N-acetyltransferase [Bacillus tropicus]MDA1777126.1 GNAT family N-acetyltransferase [Bacillus cereus group sp. BY9-3LC]MDA1805008.1 GNAT family N-acetyltransferase [Bacillus cereus group sp. BY32LC]
MMRKLSKKDHEQVFTYLKEEAALNLFIIGDIEAFGYDTDFQELWGVFKENGTLQSILLRFHDAFIPYSQEEFVVSDYGALLSAYKPLKLSGKSTIVERFETVSNIQLGTKNEMYFCECLDADNLPSTPAQETIKLATLDIVERIIQLRSNISEFPTANESEKILRQALETNTGRTYYIEKDGAIIASASTSAENSLSAMVIGVCTHPNYRGNGYASLILQKMIRDFTDEGRTLCLFYNNPAAGRIYKRLGFKDIGMWTMYR